MKKRNRVFQKIENDYKAFREEMSLLDPEEVFDSAYKIYCITEFYYILTNSYDYTSKSVALILNFKGNIFEQIYDEWLSVDTSNQDEFVDTIDSTINMLSTA